MKQFDCDVYQDLMPLVKDGAASRATCQALEEHLAVCGACRQAFDDLPETPEQENTDTFQEIRRGVKSRLRLAAILLAVLCLIPTAWYAVWSGNPISEAVIRSQSRAYLAQQYPGNDFTVDDPRYSMKSMGYTVEVRSRSSRDTHFVLNYGYFGGDCWDGYEDFVTSGTNTFSRISEDVRNLVEPELEGLGMVSVGLASDWPSIYDEFGYPFQGERIEIATLQVDGDYDPHELSECYGRVELSTEVSHASVEEIAGILTQVHQRLTARGIAVDTVDVTVYDRDSSVAIAGFRFSEIPGEGLEARVADAAAAWEEFQRAFEAWILEKNGE